MTKEKIESKRIIKNVKYIVLIFSSGLIFNSVFAEESLDSGSVFGYIPGKTKLSELPENISSCKPYDSRCKTKNILLDYGNGPIENVEGNENDLKLISLPEKEGKKISLLFSNETLIEINVSNYYNDKITKDLTRELKKNFDAKYKKLKTFHFEEKASSKQSTRESNTYYRWAHHIDGVIIEIKESATIRNNEKACRESLEWMTGPRIITQNYICKYGKSLDNDISLKYRQYDLYNETYNKLIALKINKEKIESDEKKRSISAF